MKVKFTAVGQVDLSWMFPPQTEMPEARQACLIESDEGNGYRSRRFGELRVGGDGTMTFIQEGPVYLLEPRPNGGENVDK